MTESNNNPKPKRVGKPPVKSQNNQNNNSAEVSEQPKNRPYFKKNYKNNKGGKSPNRKPQAGEPLATAVANALAATVGSESTDVATPAQSQSPKRNHRTPNRNLGNKTKRSTGRRGTPIKITSLGGVHEIGKNLTVYECGSDMFMVDCGLSFPDDDMLGIDLVIPDFTHLIRNVDKLRGLVLTHGHEDHIGAIPYLIKQGINIPIYGTKLTLGILEGKLKEHGLLNKAKLNVVTAGTTVKLGCMAVEFIAVNHSIPDACGLAIFTPAGTIIQTGDFKIDFTPVMGEPVNLARFGELGSKGVLALLPDSTNADKPGLSLSEKTVSDSFANLFRNAGKKRILIATFASNVHRIQTIFNYAIANGRKVAVSGRSMENVVAKATELGYLKYPPEILVNIDHIKNYRDENIVIVTTGSQGEPMSALARMATNDHRKISITDNDFIIISAHAIPGNEKLVNRLVNDLMKLGADVIYDKRYNTHVSGHANQEDLKLMLQLTKPKFVIPLHGEYKHLKCQKDLALDIGIPSENILIPHIGKEMLLDGVDIKVTGDVPAGRVMVDGLGIGDVGSIVLRDRKHLSEDGLIVVVSTIDSATGDIIAGPDIVSRGFVYVRESEDMMKEAREICLKALNNTTSASYRDWNGMKQAVREQLNQYIYSKTKRNPMILPIIQEV